MTLLDHFAVDAGTEPGENGFNRLPAHQFTDSIYLWAIDEITRAQVITAWSLTANDDVALNDVIRIDVDAISTTAPKGLLVTLGFREP